MSATFLSALEDFRRARRRAALEVILSRLTGKSTDLLPYEQVSQMLKVTESEPRGLQEIPLDAIVGSVGRYTDFTRSFLPRRDVSQERWARVEMAASDPRGLPPIDVYQIGQVYFVADGNHRVSVARRLGAKSILAHVTEVHTKVTLTPDVSPDDLILKAEYADFLERTRLDQVRPQADLGVTVPGQYPQLLKHIRAYHDVFRLYLRRQVPCEEAVARWYDQVYLPVVNIIRERGVLRDLPGRTETDLYLWVLEHRDALQEELGWPVRPEAAANDLVEHFSPRPRRLARRLGNKLLSAVRPDKLADGPAPGQWRQEQLATGREDHLFADILVPVSGAEMGWQALAQAQQIARREAGRLLGLHVVAKEEEKSGSGALAVQAEFSRRCAEAGLAGKLFIEAGGIAHMICERARWADLVVVNLAHPPEPQPVARLRSGFRTLIRRCPRPVMAVSQTHSRLESVLLAYDGSAKAEEALFVAAYLASRWGISLAVLTIIEARRITARTLVHAQRYLENHSVQATYLKNSGPVAEAILRTAEEGESDLIIMGGYGWRPELEVVLGSAVDQVLRESQLPVLICR
jgi:nucleotide-binding universal stress UspA family protein